MPVTFDRESIETVRENWAGRAFKCTATNETVTIPEDVMPGDFFRIGNCYLDVGDGIYFRGGGVTLEEITSVE